MWDQIRALAPSTLVNQMKEKLSGEKEWKGHFEYWIELSFQEQSASERELKLNRRWSHTHIHRLHTMSHLKFSKKASKRKAGLLLKVRYHCQLDNNCLLLLASLFFLHCWSAAKAIVAAVFPCSLSTFSLSPSLFSLFCQTPLNNNNNITSLNSYNGVCWESRDRGKRDKVF